MGLSVPPIFRLLEMLLNVSTSATEILALLCEAKLPL